MKLILLSLVFFGSTALGYEQTQKDLKKNFDDIRHYAERTVGVLQSTGDKDLQCVLIGLLEGEINAGLRTTTRNINQTMTNEQLIAVGIINRNVSNALAYCGLYSGPGIRPARTANEAAEEIQNLAEIAHAQGN